MKKVVFCLFMLATLSSVQAKADMCDLYKSFLDTDNQMWSDLDCDNNPGNSNGVTSCAAIQSTYDYDNGYLDEHHCWDIGPFED